ncbi:hypothetical protein TPHA_0H02480 [Tetrapisispora phaffii CBS 4417]|uniref:BZIP domain-containing protein n=1 Tax=Tetrapisispora phaffii (strain ATCC 24235 / CBS 4417 / NBRC 1672 / NRRL Y-8282 / UCD 70-5) TaxID=1071381 RepID=G8BWK0_TETPH|nr:hypothetical protein TPHA_0H02480 [Tetrapisispora phaffii CBS 4417]CCE64451.1 hypothetical protein TPHA_0H02480 [Tetrapisispora phaffii CBS 4417]
MNNQNTKFPKLEPKVPLANNLYSLNLQFSRDCVLPARPTSTRKGGSINKVAQESQKLSKDKSKMETLTSPESDKNDDIDDTELKRKRKLNREAQRAFRERKSLRMEQLKDTIERLQDSIDMWEKKFKKCQGELRRLRKENLNFKKEHIALKSSLEELKTIKTKEGFTGVLGLPKTHDPLIGDLINNFKPMDAISLKNKNKETYSKRANDRKPSTLNSLKSREKVSLSVPRCGLCTDESFCVCSQLSDPVVARTNNERKQTTIDATPAADTLSKLTCSSNPASCSKCADIDRSCIGTNSNGVGEAPNLPEPVSESKDNGHVKDTRELVQDCKDLDYIEIQLSYMPKKKKGFESCHGIY